MQEQLRELNSKNSLERALNLKQYSISAESLDHKVRQLEMWSMARVGELEKMLGD